MTQIKGISGPRCMIGAFAPTGGSALMEGWVRMLSLNETLFTMAMKGLAMIGLRLDGET